MANNALVTQLSRSINSETARIMLAQEVDKIIADSSDSDLKVLRHGEAANLAFEMYKEYISPRDFTFYVNWMRDLDNLIYKYRGHQPLNLDNIDEDDEDTGRRKGKKSKLKSRGVKSFAPPVPRRDVDDTPPPEERSATISSEYLTKIKKQAKKLIK